MLQHLTGTLISESRSAENPSHSILDGWETGHRTDTGLHMNGSRALEYAPVWQAVSLISGDLAGLPLEVHKRDDSDGTKDELSVENPPTLHIDHDKLDEDIVGSNA